MFNQKAAGRTRRGIRSVDRLQAVWAPLAIGQIQLNETAVRQIVTHHRLWHIPPADPLLQKHVLGAEVGKPPCMSADHCEFMALSEWRAIGEHELNMTAGRTRGMRAACKGMVRRGHRHELDEADANTLQTQDVDIQWSANSDCSRAVQNDLRHRAKCLDI